MFRILFAIVNVIYCLGSCTDKVVKYEQIPAITDSFSHLHDDSIKEAEKMWFQDSIPLIRISPGNLNPDTMIKFAESLIGTPYKYASTDPYEGFDCSGFITYVFNHYKIKVPRSSKDFENVGKTIPLNETRRGDLILFTGTDSTERTIGHMGIIVSNLGDSIKFIHSSSGKAHGVIITNLQKYYMSRFVKVIRIFN